MVLAALAGTSLVVESIQAVTRVGVPDVADLAANCVGAGIGVAVATILASGSLANDRRLTVRSRRFIASASVVAVVVAVVGLFVGASRHQQSVENALRTVFDGTDLSSIEAMLDTDPAAVFGAVDDYADGTRRSDVALEIRYPAAFFGVDRCVFVVWTSSGVAFRKASGRDCTEFIDGQF